MPNVFSDFNDRPSQIIVEGQNISLNFRIDNTTNTGTVTWNIPPPANGCNADNQAYNGILITLDTRPANYISTSPQNAKYYKSDATADPSLFLGDKIDTAMVMAAFYNDKTTTSLTITDIDPTKFYYVSGYAVDNVGTYHREGVHAYSLPIGVEETDKSTPDLNAFVDVGVDTPIPVVESTSTGLLATQDYDLHIRTNPPEGAYAQGANVTNFYGTDYHIIVHGPEALTYGDLVNTLNNKFKCLDNPIKSVLPPFVNDYYLDVPNQTLYQSDGYTLNEKNVTFFNADPSTAPVGTYWFNPNTKVMSLYNGTNWGSVSFTSLDHAPNKPVCGQLWFTGTNVYEWDGDHWCELCLYVDTRNPSLAPALTCNSYWYDVQNGLVYKWNDDLQRWDQINVIIYDNDPNTISTGSFWYDSINEVVNRFSAGVWNVVNNVVYLPPNADGTIDSPTASDYWFNTDSNQLFQRDSTNSSWTERPIAIYDADPRKRQSCDYWWNQSPSSDILYAWDSVENQWVYLERFFQSVTDPSLPPDLPPCAVWYNPTTQTLTYILDNNCSTPEFIFSLTNPRTPTLNSVWFDNVNDIYYSWDGSRWVQVVPIVSTYDPFIVADGYYWYNASTNRLYVRKNGAWVTLTYVTTKSAIIPAIGSEWLDIDTNTLYQWTGAAWLEISGKIIVKLNTPMDMYNYRYNSYLRFWTREAGCSYFIEIIPEASGLFAYCKPSVIYYDPAPGGSGLDAGPMYKQLGVGTDGSPDERRDLHATIRKLLGSPSVQVELDKEQIDRCIDNALLQLRKYSSVGYRRGMFFLDVNPNQQIYQLTNKCVGFNKITSVRGIHRLKSAFFRTGFAGNDLFGFAALQQLYTIGTFDMVSFHLMSRYIEQLEQLFSTKVMYQWVEESRELRLYQAITYKERFLVDAYVERTEQNLMTDRESAIWIQKWALAEAKKILSQVRGKFTVLPGPTGSTTLNAQDLESQAEAEMATLMEQITDLVYQDRNDTALQTHMILG